jgi:enoyl-CoA hydratase
MTSDKQQNREEEMNKAASEVDHVYKCQEFTSTLYKDEIIYRKNPQKKCAYITFNRPNKLNSIPIAGFEKIVKLIKQAEQDDEVKVIIFEGNGPCFGTGADASELGYYIGYGSGKTEADKRKPAQRRRMMPDKDVLYGSHGVDQAILRCMKVTICKVHGYCYGGHLQIAAAADIVIASENSLFTHPAWRYLGPLFNFTLLLETVGLRKLKEMVLTCRPLSAVEAETCGFVNRVVKKEELDQTVSDYVQAISVMALDGIAMGKALIEQVLESRGVGVGATTAWMGHGWMTNMRIEKDEWNFVKNRRDKGLTKALAERDLMVPKFFRMGKAREE